MLACATQNLWKNSLSNDWGYKAQGNNSDVRYMEAIDFIHQNEVRQGRNVTDATFDIDYLPLKMGSTRVCIIVGGD